jgi:hypothetical protein
MEVDSPPASPLAEFTLSKPKREKTIDQNSSVDSIDQEVGFDGEDFSKSPLNQEHVYMEDLMHSK